MEFYPSLLKLGLWVCFVILQCHGCSGGCAGDERAALLEIKASVMFADHDLSTWVEDKTSDYCAWERIKCSDTTGCVSQLDLYEVLWGDSLLNATSFLPFKDLQYLDISDNGINGSKRHQGFDKLAKLKKLQGLNLGGNNFNSNVLEALSELTSLRILYLDGCFKESSSSEISQGILKLSNLKKLEVLSLQNNKLNTKILASLGEITSLKALYLGANYIGEGSTSSELSQGFEKLLKLKRLQFLDLHYNNLKHTSILVSLSKLTSLQNLSLSHNQLRMGSSIEISQGFCELKKLHRIDLSYNNLEGEIPLCLVNFTSLRMLDLSENQLGGIIPTSLTSNMTSLKWLDLSNNHFTGTTWITSSVEQNFQLKHLGLSNCNLNTSTTSLLKFLHGQSELRFIDLSHSNIHGDFPNWLLANNTKLDTLVLNNNSFSGDIHFPLHRHTNLRFIDISKNHIGGHLQTNLGQVLQRVEYLYVSQNHLEGSIPTSLGNMQQIITLDLSDNHFTGEIPGSLTGLPVEYLILSNNRLHGQIFLNSSFNRAVRLNNNQFTAIVAHNTNNDWSLDTLDVSNNKISGRIPSWIANLTGVSTLVMGDNFFHGFIPLELCNIASLEFLDLSQNELSGNVLSFLNLSSLRYMQFEGNKLSGSLPSAILRSPNLEALNLNHNHFSGSIPGWFALLENLRILLLNRNRLSGFLPYELCRSSRISIMDLSHNGLSGKIPPCLSNISFGQSGELLQDFDDGYGLISYSLDDYKDNLDLIYRRIVPKPYVSQEEAEFVTKGVSSLYKGDILNYMSGMDLSCNNFTGNIPYEFEALTAIHALNLSHNQLTGSIPRTLSKLKQLESMDLSHNKLSGEIPSELADLNFLGTFSVAYNNLSGHVPIMQQFGTFDDTSYWGNPYLCGPPLLKQCNSAAAPTGSVTATDAALSDVFGVDPISFLASCVGAYVVSFMALVIVLYINPYWRRLWFDFIDACLRFMFPFWAEAFDRVSNPFT